MDLAGIIPLVHAAVVAQVGSTKFIGTLETIPHSTTTVTLLPLDAATAAQNDYAINGVAALDIGSIVWIKRLPSA